MWLDVAAQILPSGRLSATFPLISMPRLAPSFVGLVPCLKHCLHILCGRILLPNPSGLVNDCPHFSHRAFLFWIVSVLLTFFLRWLIVCAPSPMIDACDLRAASFASTSYIVCSRSKSWFSFPRTSCWISRSFSPRIRTSRTIWSVKLTSIPGSQEHLTEFADLCMATESCHKVPHPLIPVLT